MTKKLFDLTEKQFELLTDEEEEIYSIWYSLREYAYSDSKIKESIKNSFYRRARNADTVAKRISLVSDLLMAAEFVGFINGITCAGGYDGCNYQKISQELEDRGIYG